MSPLAKTSRERCPAPMSPHRPCIRRSQALHSQSKPVFTDVSIQDGSGPICYVKQYYVIYVTELAATSHAAPPSSSWRLMNNASRHAARLQVSAAARLVDEEQAEGADVGLRSEVWRKYPDVPLEAS